MNKKNLIIWGASGHALALSSYLEENGSHLEAMIDENLEIKDFNGTNVFNNLLDLKKTYKNLNNYYFLIAIGGDKGPERLRINNLLIEEKMKPYTFVHPSSWVDHTAHLADGVQVMGMAAVSAYVRIGMQTIINTNATVDHETEIGHGSHIMPSASVAGCCKIGNNCTIGSNATILPRIKIADDVYVGAGAVVIEDILLSGKYVGVPAKRLSS